MRPNANRRILQTKEARIEEANVIYGTTIVSQKRIESSARLEAVIFLDRLAVFSGRPRRAKLYVAHRFIAQKELHPKGVTKTNI